MSQDVLEDDYLDIGVESASVSLESGLYDIYYRTHGVRRMMQLENPVISDMSNIELPKDSIYHYNPESPLLFGPLETNPWFKNETTPRFIQHVAAFPFEPIGTIVRKPGAEQQFIQAYRRKHRALRLLRDFFGVNRQSRMLMVVNYCILNQLYKYRPHRMVSYYRFYNMYKTIFMQMEKLASTSHRQQFFELRLPQILPSRQKLRQLSKDYEKGITSRYLQTFNDDDSWLLFHFWMWLSGNQQHSVFNHISQRNLDKINIAITDSGKYVLINLGKLNAWRLEAGSEEDAEEIDTNDNDTEGLDEEDIASSPEDALSVRLSVRVYRLFINLLSLRTGSGVREVDAPKYTEAELNDTTPVEEESDSEPTQVEKPEIVAPVEETPETPKNTHIDPIKVAEKTKELVTGTKVDDKPKTLPKSDAKAKLPPLPGVKEVEEPPELVFDTDTSELDDAPPIVAYDEDPTEDIEEEQIETIEENSYTTPIVEEARKALAVGTISAKQYNRLIEQSEVFKKLPNPYNDKETIEEAITVKPGDIVNVTKRKVPDNDWILDKSMLEITQESISSEYIEKMLPKNIMQSVMSVQKAGIMVKNVERQVHADKVNRFETLKVKVQPIGGTETTLSIKLPIVDPTSGEMLSQNVRYRSLNQRKDLPIRKVSPDKVSLTTYYGKLFVNKSERRSFNLEKYLITQIQAKMVDGLLSRVEYHNVFDKKLKLPSMYSYFAKRFKGFEVNNENRPTVSCYFDYHSRGEHFKLSEQQLASLELKADGVLFAKDSQGLYSFIKPNGNIATIDASTNVIVDTTIEAFFLFPVERPIEMVEIKIFSKSVPMGIILGYYIGLSKLLKLLSVKPRKVFRGQRMDLSPNEYPIKFADETWIFDKRDYHAALILNGFNHYKRFLSDYSVHQFDEPDVYGALMKDAGLAYSVEEELILLKRMFIDEISRTLLQQMNEPTEFVPLLIRATELLTTTQSNDEINMDDMIIAGYQRIAGHVYSELVKNIKAHNRKTSMAKKRFDLPPNSIFNNIMQDASTVLIDDINPLHNIKEHDNVTFGGDGGRSKRSMVGRTREYHESDIGTISEGSVDNANVGVTTFLSANSNITSMYGNTERLDKDDYASAKIFSACAALAVGGDTDDQQKQRLLH